MEKITLRYFVASALACLGWFTLRRLQVPGTFKTGFEVEEKGSVEEGPIRTHSYSYKGRYFLLRYFPDGQVIKYERHNGNIRMFHHSSDGMVSELWTS